MSSFVESLYYQIYNKVLLCDSENAKMYLSFLRDEFDKDIKQFDVLKKDERWEHLVKLGEIIDNDLIDANSEVVFKSIEKTVKQDEEMQVKKQDELTKLLMQNNEILGKCLNADSDFYCEDFEQETIFGRVDLVARDNHTIYPIELKKSTADHSVVGQVMKYILSFKLGLINRSYDNVVGVVIANGFDEYTLQQLSKNGIVTVRYKIKEDKLELTRV